MECFLFGEGVHFVDRVIVFFELFFLLIREGIGKFFSILAHQGEQVFELPVLDQESFVRVDVTVLQVYISVICNYPIILP